MPMKINKKSLTALMVLCVPILSFAQSDDSFLLPPIRTTDDQELSQALTVFVNRIEVRGVTAIDPAAVSAVTGPYEGRDVTSAELQELRLQLSNLYLDNRFVSSGVILPDQSVADGVIYFQAVEGQLSRIEIEGDPKIRSGYLGGLSDLFERRTFFLAKILEVFSKRFH